MNKKILFVGLAIAICFLPLAYLAFAFTTPQTSLDITNEAPLFTGQPQDGSSGISPTNVGQNVTFTGTATDPNGDQWYLAICKSLNITGGDNAAPTCADGAWAMSGATDSGSQATATYTTLVGDDESNPWYAFACDKVVGEGICNWENDEQPFYVNHRPSIGAVAIGPTCGSSASVDPGNSVSAKVTTSFGFGSILSVANQSDGKTIAVGAFGTYNFELIRYNTDGSLDTSFDSDGRVSTTIMGYDQSNSVAIQSDGKIVVAGAANDGNVIDFGLARYNLDGSLDTTFDIDGKVTTNILNNDYALSVAIQSDGKIVVGGIADNNSAQLFALTRYNTDGSLDTSFDSDGIATTGFANTTERDPRSIVIQPDGKILIAGSTEQGLGDGTDFALARFNADGSLDTSFDSDGRVTTSLSIANDKIWTLAVDSNGKIVAGGESYNALAIARYNADGSLDTSFDSDGIATTALSPSTQSIALQSDGKIIAAGSWGAFSVLRFNSNGSLDTSFDSDGIATTAFWGEANHAITVAIRADGKIIVAGDTETSPNRDWALARFKSDGTLDDLSSYACVQTTVTDPDTDTAADTVDMYVCSTNSFVSGACAATTLCTITGVKSGHTAQCTINGQVPIPSAHGNYNAYVFLIDSHGFGDAGTANTQSYSVTDTPPFITQASDYIVSDITLSAGASTAKSYTVTVKDNNGDNDITAVTATLYDDNGSPSTLGFGTGGHVTTDFDNWEQANAIAKQADGKIVVGGKSNTGAIDLFALSRYNTDGSLDSTFGTGGMVTTQVDSGTLRSIAIQSDGKIVAAGTGFAGGYEIFVVIRYDTNGSLDTTFDNDGIAASPVFGYTNTSALYAVAIQSDGKIVAVGSSYNYDTFINYLSAIRYNADGSVDSTFGTNGIANVATPGSGSQAKAVAIQTDGKIVVGGVDWNTSQYIVVRLNTDGTEDTTFGSPNGYVIGSIGNNSEIVGISLQSDGKIVATGASDTPATGQDFTVMRFNSDGYLDETTFGSPNGYVTTDINYNGSNTNYPRAVAIQGDGKIVVAGQTGDYINNDFMLIRYNTDGSPDTTFGSPNGYVTTDFFGFNDEARSLILQTDGKIVAAGSTDPDGTGNNGNFALARYNIDGSQDAASFGLAGGTCTYNEWNCYSGVACTLSNNTSGTDTDATATCNFTAWFNMAASTGWYMHANPADQNGAVTNLPDSNAITTNALEAIDVPEATIPYGTIALGAVSSGQTITIQNEGNQVLDVLVQGTDMARVGGGPSIGHAQQKWNATTQDFDYDTAGNTLVFDSSGAMEGATGCADKNLAVRTAHASGVGSDDNLFFKLKIPDSLMFGTYSGTNTLVATSSSQCVDLTPGSCGNNLIQGAETCDDGNTVSGDGCSATCQAEYSCPNDPTRILFVGVLNAGCTRWNADPVKCELSFLRGGPGIVSCFYDAGTSTCRGCGGAYPCTNTCLGPNCGNGALDAGETCDDGNNTFGDGCTNVCTIDLGYTCNGSPSVCQKCGDSLITGTETCDDGNTTPGDGCSNVCAVESGFTCAGVPSNCSVCGNGIIGGTEACDDGNTTPGDGCSNVCAIESGYSCSGAPSVCQLCGNSLIEGTEACDDGNTTPGDGCSNVCAIESGYSCVGIPSACDLCGNGTVGGTETCDEGILNGTPNHCNATCSGTTTPVCGNGTIESGETCDDGNTTPGDGCSNVCAIESGYTCNGQPSVCTIPFVIFTDFGNNFGYEQSVAIQSDGKIVEAGSTTNDGSFSAYNFALARHNTDGSLDTSFGTGGKVVTDIGGNRDQAYSVAIQTDGKIVAAGTSSNGGDRDFALVRYNTDGSLDTSFGMGGKVTTNIASVYDSAYSVAIQADGKIVALGDGGTSQGLSIARYNTDGSLDSAFGSGGKTSFASLNAYEGGKVLFQGDGKIIGVGNYGAAFGAVRLNSDGSLDTSFGSGGIVSTNFDDNSTVFSAIMQSDGKVVIAGSTHTLPSGHNNFALARYNTDGSLDTGFGTGGKITTAIGSLNDYAYSVAIQGDGKIVASGTTQGSNSNDFAVVRYNTDGSLDTGFGIGGKVVTSISNQSDYAFSVAIQSDGKIVAGGRGELIKFALVRYTTTGAVDVR